MMEGELALEMGEGFVTAIGGDLVHGLVGFSEESACATDAEFVQVARKGPAGAFFEEATEGTDAEAGELGEDG